MPRITTRIALAALGISILTGALIDRLWITEAFPNLSAVLTLKPGPKLFNKVFFREWRVGIMPILTFAALTMVALVLPYGKFRNAHSWRVSLGRWCWAMLGLVSLPVAALLGGFLVEITKEYVWDWLVTLLTAFGFAPTFYVFDTEIVMLDASVGSFLFFLAAFVYLARYLRTKDDF